MLRTRFRAALLSAVVSIAGVLGCAGSAQAAFYTGTWDPTFGGIFPDLGWKGTATFFIPDACLSESGTISNSDACSGGGMKLLSASVDFYNATLDPAGLNILETLTFDPLALPVGFIYSMDVTDGQLTGVSSAFSAPVQAFSSIAGNGTYFFDLTFLDSDSDPNSLGGAQLAYTKGAVSPYCAFNGSTSKCGFSQTTAAVAYAPAVPEPESYALMPAKGRSTWVRASRLQSPNRGTGSALRDHHAPGNTGRKSLQYFARSCL